MKSLVDYKIVNISTREGASGFVSEDGKVFTCGWFTTYDKHRNYLLGHNKQEPETLPKQVEALKGEFFYFHSMTSVTDVKIVKVRIGRSTTAFITDEGKLYVVGSDSPPHLGFKEEKFMIKEPILVESIQHKRVVDIHIENSYSALLTSDGEVYSCGGGDQAMWMTGHNTRISFSTFQRIRALDPYFVQQLSSYFGTSTSIVHPRKYYKKPSTPGTLSIIILFLFIQR
jgi:alpha-tubulin suppressor-like RCC1 family protein